jgi:heat shock protein HtpX
MAISRTREYGADAGGARISGRPLAHAAALEKLHRAAAHVPNPVAEANPAAAALYIVNPLTGGARDQLFSTHPAPENRIAALVRLAGAVPDASRRPSALGLGRRRNPWR